jgi:hypothetical protein
VALFPAILSIALIAAAMALSIRLWHLILASGPARNDLRPGDTPFRGRSRFWQFNVLREANYRPEGLEEYRRIRQLYVLIGALVFSAAAILAYFYVFTDA